MAKEQRTQTSYLWANIFFKDLRGKHHGC